MIANTSDLTMQRALWRQFAVLMCIALAIPLAQYAALYHARAPQLGMSAVLWGALLESPRQFYYLLAIVPAIALGISYMGRRDARAAAGAVGATLLVMIVVDLWIAPVANRQLATRPTSATGESSAPNAIAAAPVSPIDSIGVLRSAATLLREQPAALAEHLRSYPPGHPRVVAERVIEDGAVLLLPVILAGLTIGVAAWVRTRVIFRSMRDQVVARWFLAWVIAPAAFALIGSWSSRYSYDILFRGGSLWLPLLPYVPFAILGALGWRAALNEQPAGSEMGELFSEPPVVRGTPAA